MGDAEAMRGNQHLSDMFERTGLSQGELARRITTKARRNGLRHITPDATNVRRWLQGTTPRDPMLQRVVADVFSDICGYRVTTYDLGFGESPDLDRPLAYSPSFRETVESVTELKVVAEGWVWAGRGGV
ncbi:hypothetical protein [Streptomyces cavourensis]|uniref:hypothetical protein n=1 Tax=Streptomyces cavourensis TaxID=67258 RepID=UPI001F086A2C|nr:hypothetical protein [Streptomyces cavourensis]